MFLSKDLFLDEDEAGSATQQQQHHPVVVGQNPASSSTSLKAKYAGSTAQVLNFDEPRNVGSGPGTTASSGGGNSSEPLDAASRQQKLMQQRAMMQQKMATQNRGGGVLTNSMGLGGPIRQNHNNFAGGSLYEIEPQKRKSATMDLFETAPFEESRDSSKTQSPKQSLDDNFGSEETGQDAGTAVSEDSEDDAGGGVVLQQIEPGASDANDVVLPVVTSPTLGDGHFGDPAADESNTPAGVGGPFSPGGFSSGESPHFVEQALQSRGLAPVFDPTGGFPPEPAGSSLPLGTRRFDPSMIGSSLPGFLMNRLPRGVLMECQVTRAGGIASKFYPKYKVFTGDTGFFLMSAQKRKKNKTSNYCISMGENDLNPQSVNCLGKLRSNFMGSEFVAYSSGLNPAKGENRPAEEYREELCAVTYSSTLWGKKPRGPRKMSVIVPRLNGDDSRVICRPIRTDGSDGLLQAGRLAEQHQHSGELPVEVFTNKAPKWNDSLGAFVLNFNKRVTQASVKNFQLISQRDPDTVVLQFGRIAKDQFTMDFFRLLPLFSAVSTTNSAANSWNWKLQSCSCFLSTRVFDRFCASISNILLQGIHDMNKVTGDYREKQE
ncbi:unnamed protein product [Amoebophrya sp. A25]|nr:unnamed protein product [Amoebophrya sp. A25]|eukprot:GSA25T00009193001.1